MRTNFYLRKKLQQYIVFIYILLPLSAAFASTLEVDCKGNNCPVIEINGDHEALLPNGDESPFSGFADATIRLDKQSDRLWMAYSWPNVRIGKRGAKIPQVEIHLAYSDDYGKHWQFEKTLWSPTPTFSPDNEAGYTSHEVANLLPVTENGATVWYAARLDYFLPDRGGFRNRPPQSFRIIVTRAKHPTELTNAAVVSLGSMATDNKWGMDVNLAALSSETRHCSLWNEPALYYKGGELFLALSCMAFKGKTPDLEQNDLVVFATKPQQLQPAQWKWRYVSKLSGALEAKELGAGRLTQIDLAVGIDGKLLAIVTPDTWNTDIQDFVHQGCRVIDVDTSGGIFKLKRDSDGHLMVRAKVAATDAGESGTAACTYDSASHTGVILDKRVKIGVGLGGKSSNRTKAEMHVSQHATGINP